MYIFVSRYSQNHNTLTLYMIFVNLAIEIFMTKRKVTIINAEGKYLRMDFLIPQTNCITTPKDIDQLKNQFQE